MNISPLENGKLELTNDGRLQLFFLGVGSAFTKRQYQTNLMIIQGDTHLLIDCGTRCTHSLYEVGRSITDIHNFLITHSHADHIGGLEEAALMGRYVTKQKPLMIINETYQHILWDMSLRGGCAHNEEEAGDILNFTDFFEVQRPEYLTELPRMTHESQLGPLNLKMMRTKHIPDSSNSWESSFWSCGVILNERVFFTSDTRYDPELLKFYDDLYNFEMIFHDCQFFTGGVHASLDELAQLPEKLRKKIILVHYGDNWEQMEEKIKELGFAGLGKQHCYYDFQ